MTTAGVRQRLEPALTVATGHVLGTLQVKSGCEVVSKTPLPFPIPLLTLSLWGGVLLSHVEFVYIFMFLFTSCHC